MSGKAAAMPDADSLDRPEATSILVGHQRAEMALLDSYRSGRVPHAWALEGPKGIGKATLAFRFARFVLAHPAPDAPDVAEAADLAVSPDGSDARQIAARAHPNLIVLERPRDEAGKATSSIIPVDSVRRVSRFLATTAAGGNWRIVVVDAADDLNRASANALLKMLEEPPARCLFLLVAHLPGRLLPTIRSRCRRLALKPLDPALIETVLRTGDEAGGDPALAARLAQGSLGRALELASAEGQETARRLLDLLEGMPRLDAGDAMHLAEWLGARGGEGRYRLASELLLDWIAQRTRSAAGDGRAAAQLARWSEVWEKVGRALAQTEIYNLDRTQTLLTALRSVSTAAVTEVARA